jgi:hypothetical protein
MAVAFDLGYAKTCGCKIEKKIYYFLISRARRP